MPTRYIERPQYRAVPYCTFLMTSTVYTPQGAAIKPEVPHGLHGQSLTGSPPEAPPKGTDRATDFINYVK